MKIFCCFEIVLNSFYNNFRQEFKKSCHQWATGLNWLLLLLLGPTILKQFPGTNFYTLSGIFNPSGKFLGMRDTRLQETCEHCIIRKINALCILRKEELKRISDSRVTKIIKKGNPVFNEGEHLQGIFCVRKGVSKLSKISSEGRKQILKLATSGEVLGLTSLFTMDAAYLSATAVDDMEVCFIPKERIMEAVQGNPEYAMELLHQLAQDVKEADSVIVNMSLKTVKQRMAEAILHVRDTFGEDKDGFLKLKLSRDDIASLVGTATESCIRIISEFKKRGWLRTSGKKIGVADVDELRRVLRGF